MAYTGSHQQPLAAWLDAGLAAHRQGDLDRAMAAYRQILALAPDHGPALNLLGTAVLQLGRPAEAVPYLERAARRQRDDPQLLANLAQAYLACGRHGDAVDTFRKASRLAPRDVHFQLGTAAALAMQGKLAEAETMLQRLAVRFPKTPAVWLNLGNALRDLKRPHDAIAAYGTALELDPAYLDARNGLGSMLHSLQRFTEAETHYRACLKANPQFALARYNLASVLIDLGRFQEAEVMCREIVAAEPASSQGHRFLGAAVAHQGRLVEALACQRRAAALAPDDPRSGSTLGASLMEVGQVAAGRRLLADAIDADPESPSPRQLLSTQLLAHGCLQDGWIDYAGRPAALRFREKYPHVELATSLPAVLDGSRACVLREQGLGDEIFLLRYARVLSGKGARISYRASNKIASLLARAPFIDEVLPEKGPLPDADAHLLVGDLPRMLGRAPSSALPRRQERRIAVMRDFAERVCVYWPPVPSSIEIEPAQDRIAEVRVRLAALGPPPYIGLTWRAGTPPEEQKWVTWALYKEIHTASFAGSLKGIDATFVALQRNPAAGEIDRVAAALGKPVHDLTAYNEDLEGMLALLDTIDDYVGVSNTNMHLRAAAGRSARVLVPMPAEWRWTQSGRASPWFPGFTIYRQSLQGDWSPALAALASDLELNYGGDRSSTPRWRRHP